MVLLHRVAKGAASLVGLGQEAYANRQKNKHSDTPDDGQHGEIAGSSHQSRAGSELRYVSDNGSEPGEGWGPKQQHDIETEIREHVVSNGVQDRLPAPVVIPQRRPNTRSRGFLCAYAPALAACGIEQEPFLEFLDGFRSEAEKGGAFTAFNLAVALGSIALEGAELIPSPSLHFAALAVHLSVEAGKKAYVNKKTNEYLDQINASMFEPHGLYAMIMTYDPATTEPGEMVDFDAHTAQAVQKSTTETALKGKFQTSSAETLESQMPEICELIFPESRDGDDTEQSGLKKSFAFAMDYYDRRSQAAYAAHNPESSLNVREHEFAGRYANPTTFENSSVLGVLTGGVVDPRGRKMERRAAREAERQAAKGVEKKEAKKERTGLIGSVRDMLHVGVLYLLIVNMPSEAELEYARQAASKAQESGGPG